ncbi:Uncharacterised protein [Enterobacter cloacae]|nr:Uncharacterised protein [Enterobacter cloacae]
MVAERLSGVHVTQVDLDKRDTHREQCVAYSNTGVRKRGRIDQDIVHSVFSLMNTVDDCVLRVRLKMVQIHIQRRCFRTQTVNNFAQC